MKKQKFPIHVVLEDVRSAFNVGAVFRTSDAAGVEKLWLTGITPYPPHNRIPKTALGATASVDWEYEKDTQKVLKNLKKDEFSIVSVELTDSAQIYTEFKFPKKTALIMGNEISGVSEESLAVSDAIVKIPMFGEKESLNVEVSYAIVVYEILRQKQYSNYWL